MKWCGTLSVAIHPHNITFLTNKIWNLVKFVLATIYIKFISLRLTIIYEYTVLRRASVPLFRISFIFLQKQHPQIGKLG